MVSIQIQCTCGQAYTVEVEPVDGRVPTQVVCPTCGVDGTAAANAALAPSSPTPRLHLSQSTSSQPAARTAARQRTTFIPGQTDRTQAVYEARAKISWGDPPREVAAYLMSQGYKKEEALEMVAEMFRERASAFRAKGIKYLFGGVALILVPIVTWLIALAVGYIYVTFFLFTVAAGFCGLTMALKGISMVRSPKSQEGNVAEQ
jgi:hypothetical protein